jgi:hypothetical protein
MVMPPNVETWKRGTYIGHFPLLQNKTAIVKKSPMYGRVLAQFDDKTLEYTVCDVTIRYGFGWHEFGVKDFRYESA